MTACSSMTDVISPPITLGICRHEDHDLGRGRRRRRESLRNAGFASVALAFLREESLSGFFPGSTHTWRAKFS